MAMETDHLVVGSGLAGLIAALRLAEHGDVLLVTKRRLGDNNTSYAQGGISAVMDTQDSFDAHVRDTISAGAGLCDERVVRSVVEQGPTSIEQLVRLGVSFDRRGEDFDLTREGGHNARRILHASDLTGQEIDRALRARVAETPRIRCLTHHAAIDLIVLPGHGGEERCRGAYVLDVRSGDVLTIRAKTTLLATGGAGKVYLYTTNPDVATGDGVAMAFRAGAHIANMEFYQFHPTCLYHPSAKNFLISEALRGEGGVLRTTDGTPLMRGVHPMEDLAPRDVVAQRIDRILKQTGADHVLLDMTAREPAYLTNRFPAIHAFCLSLGIDMTRVPIPVVPAAHYMCGGVQVDLDAATSRPGLWAAGEVTCTGLHGANRLASNSLLEAIVYGNRAADSMQRAAREQAGTVPVVPEWDAGNAVDPDEEVIVTHSWDELRRTMWNYVGIVRSDKRLDRAEARVSLLKEEIQEYYWNFKIASNLIELRNIATVAGLIARGARLRRESRGAPCNLSVPQTNEVAADSVLRRGVGNSIVPVAPR